MSLTRDHGDIVFQCDTDGCSETLETRTSNWPAARNLLRRAGWQPYPNPKGRAHSDSEWNHRCCECAKGAQLPLQRAGAR